MASLSKTKTGFTVQFVAADTKRRSIRLGHLTRAQAETVKGRIEQLNAAQLAGLPLVEETARWLVSLPDTLHDRIAATGLTRKRSSGLLASFCRSFVSEHSHGVSDATLANWEYAIANLTGCFGENKPLRELTTKDAGKFRDWLKAQGLAENTIRKRCAIARQFLAQAVSERRTETNPFADIPVIVQGGQNEFFVTPAASKQILEACPNWQWRLVFGLCRFGGFRHPSETSLLTWDDIDFDRQRIRVTSPKTARHEGHGERWIPFFASLKPLIDEAWDHAEPGATKILAGVFDAGAMTRIIKRSGLLPWPKLFQNMRSSRQAELLMKHAPHVVDSWIGHSRRTAATFYSQVTDGDFADGLED